MGVSDRRPMRIAFLGAGKMAREHARAFASLEGVELAGVSSRTRGRADELARDFGMAVVADTIDELHERTRADLLVVSVIETVLVDLALHAVTKPWTLLVEKPPGLSPRDTARLARAAKEAGVRVFVGLNRQFLGSTQAALDLLGNDGPRFVHVQDQQNLAQARSLGHSDAVVNGWMYANSIHLVDYFRVFARGAVTSVRHDARFQPDDGVGLLIAHLEFQSGDRGLYQAFWRTPGPWAATVHVPGRRFELRPLEDLKWQSLGEPPQSVARPQADVDFKPGFRLQAENVLAAWRGLPSASPDLEQALRTMSLIEAIYAPE